MEEKGIFCLKRLLNYLKEKGLDSYSKTKLKKEFVRNMLPYCVQKQGEGFILLNREYKPLGTWGYSDCIDYNDYPALLISSNRGVEYFYGDSTNPNNSKYCFEIYLKNLTSFVYNNTSEYVTTIEDDRKRAKEFNKACESNFEEIKKDSFVFIRETKKEI